MAMRQTTQPSTEPSAVDLLTMPHEARRRLDRLDEERVQGIETRRRSAQGRHDARSKEQRQRLMDGATDLAGYRQALAESEARLAADLADVPPALDEELLRERVYIRALEAVATWWSVELDAAERQQQEWAPNEQGDGDGGEGGDDVQAV